MEETGGLFQNIMSNIMMTSAGVGLSQTSRGLGLFQRRPIYEVNFHVVQPLCPHFSGVDSSVRPRDGNGAGLGRARLSHTHPKIFNYFSYPSQTRNGAESSFSSTIRIPLKISYPPRPAQVHKLKNSYLSMPIK